MQRITHLKKKSNKGQTGEEKTREYAARGNPDRKVLGLSKNCRNLDDTTHKISRTKRRHESTQLGETRTERSSDSVRTAETMTTPHTEKKTRSSEFEN